MGNTNSWKTISEQLTKSLNISTDQLLLADEFNEDLALYFGRAYKSARKYRFAIFQPSSSGGNSGNNRSFGPGKRRTTWTIAKWHTTTFNRSSYWYRIFISIPFDIQQLYIPLAQQALPVVDRVVRKINALDYCVPGPNPNWQELAQSNFVALVENVPFILVMLSILMATTTPTQQRARQSKLLRTSNTIYYRYYHK